MSARSRPSSASARRPNSSPAQKPAGGSSPRPSNANVRRARARQRQQRNKWLAIGAAAVVVVVAVVFIVVKATSGGSGNQPNVSQPADPAVVNQLASVPVATLAQASKTVKVSNPLTAISGPKLVSNGKPEVVYIGAEYCPYCAATRWPMIVALSKFGTFSHLGTTTSASNDVDPNTPTFTFYGSTYHSKYLTFSPVEETTRNRNQILQQPTKAQQALAQKYDSAGSIPFIDFGNQKVLVGSAYDPAILAGKTRSTIASELQDPATSIGKNIGATAGNFVKAICGLTGNKPANVCSAFSG